MAQPVNPTVGQIWTDANGIVRICHMLSPRVWLLKRPAKHSNGASPHSDALDNDTWTDPGDDRFYTFADGIWRDDTAPRSPNMFTGDPPSNPIIGDRWNDGSVRCEFVTNGTSTFWQEY